MLVSSVRCLPHSRQLPAAAFRIRMCRTHAQAHVYTTRVRALAHCSCSYVDVQGQDIRTSESRFVRPIIFPKCRSNRETRTASGAVRAFRENNFRDGCMLADWEKCRYIDMKHWVDHCMYMQGNFLFESLIYDSKSLRGTIITDKNIFICKEANSHHTFSKWNFYYLYTKIYIFVKNI